MELKVGETSEGSSSLLKRSMSLPCTGPALAVGRDKAATVYIGRVSCKCAATHLQSYITSQRQPLFGFGAI